MSQPTSPLKLPRCNYPTVDKIQQHGPYNLQKELPLVDFELARNFRSNKYTAIPLDEFDKFQTLELAHVIARSFAINEPMNRHVHPSLKIPMEISNAKHHDALGNDPFGPWTTENILFWFVRLVLLTVPSHPIGAIGINEDLLRHSLVITNEHSKPIGGSLNITLPAEEEEWRQNDPFIDAVFSYQNPVIQFIHTHEHAAIHALIAKYPDFEKALQFGKVGYIAMIARSAELPTEHTFELFAASFEQFQKQEYEYMLITGTNQWTGAACEALGAARIYFSPFRNEQRVANEIDTNQNEPYSSDGFISDKDSGLMIYALTLQR
ncbi:hypothetical protein [Ulvibacterium marinum]|uniref:hypothetical protein n=1 Tax=Ulvibacterium marinum TaxID=2419782 RepID=UPI00249526C3|nr:hypothetical protein [Ulvibacterium marinum]